MQSATTRRTVTVLALLLGLLTAAVAPSVALVAQQDYEVAEHREGRVDPGREDDETQQFPINLTFYPIDHSPGVTGGSFEVFASGLTEDMTLHWVVLETGDFDVGTCQSTDASAFGIDRGNDGSGTATDESLLTAYRSYTSAPEGFFIEFYKESALAGEPVVVTTADQVVARQNNCVNNPQEPGWYRVTGYLNGSTKDDTTTDYTIYATSRYTYVCDCESREEAEEKLGPPPNEGGDTAAPTTATPTSEPQPTPTPEQAATATAAPDPEGTTTASQTTATAAPNEASSQDDATATATEAATTTANGAETPAQQGTARPASAATPAATATTPTLAAGPGFGGVAALLALVAAALLSVAVTVSRNRT
jgi:hypothetical protein